MTRDAQPSSGHHGQHLAASGAPATALRSAGVPFTDRIGTRMSLAKRSHRQAMHTRTVAVPIPSDRLLIFQSRAHSGPLPSCARSVASISSRCEHIGWRYGQMIGSGRTVARRCSHRIPCDESISANSNIMNSLANRKVRAQTPRNTLRWRKRAALGVIVNAFGM